jgi:hypothetical protein
MAMAWDAETLKEYVDKLFEDRDRALEAALAAMEKRLDGMNEIRGQMKDQANTLATRAEVDAKFDGITKTTRLPSPWWYPLWPWPSPSSIWWCGNAQCQQ